MKNGKRQALKLVMSKIMKIRRLDRLNLQPDCYEKDNRDWLYESFDFNDLKKRRLEVPTRSIEEATKRLQELLWFSRSPKEDYEMCKEEVLAGPRGKLP